MSKNESTAMVTRDRETAVTKKGILIQSLDELESWAERCVKARIVPPGMGVEAAMVAIQAGMERGLGPLSGLQAFYVVNNNLCWRGDAALAFIRNSNKCVPGSLKFGVTKGKTTEETKGWAKAQRVGDREPTLVEFTWQDAHRAGLTGKDNWKKYPQRMLQWRAISHLAKDLFSDVIGGFPIAEAAEDYDDQPRRQAARTEAPPAIAPGPKHDPLLDAMGGKAKPPETVTVEAEPAEAPEVTAPPTEAESAADDEAEPPFATHEEADRAIAEEEQEALFKGQS